ncbi:MAG TPA: MFS transporter [Blastocatellia bacterium]|nr:MFS transporter [Blastocatellia bacterium]
MSESSSPKRRKFFYGWWIVVVAGVGLFMSYSSIILYSFGVFFKSLGDEFNWSRAEISLALSLSLVAMTVALPPVGRLVDRFGARRVVVPSALIFGLSFMSLRFLSASLWHFYAIYLLMGVVGSGLSMVPYCGVVSHWFDRRRGLALALAMVGAGLGSSAVPSLTHALTAAVGWRDAYALMGLMVIAVTVPVVGLFLKEKPQMMGLAPDGEAIADGAAERRRGQEQGMTTGEALRSWTFWLMSVAFLFITTSVIGCLIHLAPMLTDRGVSQKNAAMATSLFGGAVILGRIGTGYLLDRFFASYVAACFFFGAGLGIFLLWTGVSGALAFVAAFLVGMGVGAEGDIITYQVSRYFGLRAFGEIYGYVLITYTLGGIIGPLVMGIGFDSTGSYRLILGLFLLATMAAVGLMMRLGPYPIWETVAEPAALTDSMAGRLKG